MLVRWQPIKNLVAPSTLADLWTRHFADSAQLLELAPDARLWLDMGSGAGFPGLVIALLMHGRPGAVVHLVESNARKCAFLREVVRTTGAPALVHNDRVEIVTPRLEKVDIVTARALAPLPRLLQLGKVPLERGARGLFLKSEAELASLAEFERDYHVDVHPSRTSPDGRIVTVRTRGPGSPPNGPEAA